MKKLCTCFVFFTVLSLCALSLSSTIHAADTATQYEWKFATLAPDGTAWSTPIKKVLFPLIQMETNNQVRIKVYWGGVMGDDEDILKKMNIGQLHGAGFSAQGTTLAVPEMSVLELPFLFNDYNEVDIIKYSMFSTFDEYMTKRGLFFIAWVDQDFDQIHSLDKPIASLADFHKTKFATWYGPVEEHMLHEFGANMVRVNIPEFTVTIRQRVVDASIGPAMWVVGSQTYSVVRYITPVKIRYSPGVIVCSLDTWKAYPELEKYKKRLFKLRRALTEAYCIIVRAYNQRALDAMYQYGVKKVETSPDQLEEMRLRSRVLWDEMAGKLYPQELLDEIIARLEEYRRIGTNKEWTAKREEAFAIIEKKRNEVLDIWANMSGNKVSSQFLEEMFAHVNDFDELYSIVAGEMRGSLYASGKIAADRAITQLGQKNALLSNPQVKIVLPENLTPVEKILKDSGNLSLVNSFVHSMNRTGEKAISQSRTLVSGAIASLSRQKDALNKNISVASGNPITKNFWDSNAQGLSNQLELVVSNCAKETGVDSCYKAMVGRAKAISPDLNIPEIDLNAYMTRKTLRAVFSTMAKEEQAFWKNPEAMVIPAIDSIIVKTR